MQPQDTQSLSTSNISDHSVTPAPYVHRFINWIVDKVLAFGISLFFVLLLYLFYRSRHGSGDKPNDLFEFFYFLFAWAVCQFAYYFLLEKFWGRTFGKALTGTQVVSEAGVSASSGALALRTIGRLIPFDEFVIFFNNRHALHDSISKTVVVKTDHLPSSMQRRGFIMKAISILLLLPALALMGNWGYEQLSGGERIALSQDMPQDLKLVRYEEMPNEHGRYYSMTFQGNDRSILINRLIAGYHYDPDEQCLNMTPSRNEYTYDKLDSAVHCQLISPDHQPVRAYRVKLPSEHYAPIVQMPDFYLYKPPYRYAIKVESGAITDEEIVAMTKNYRTYTAEQLRQKAADNH